MTSVRNRGTMAVGLGSLVFCLLGVSSASAQFKEGGEAKGPRLGEVQVQRWQFGLVVQTAAPCRDMIGYVPMPGDWPEQQLEVVAEDFSPTVRTSYQTVDGVKVMVVRIAQLPPGAEAKALVTYEVRRHAMLPPEKTEIYVLPDAKTLPKEIRPYLLASLMIEVKNAKIKAALKDLPGDPPNAWKQVEAIYEFVRGNVEYRKDAGKVKGAVAALRDGNGGVEDLTSLFIALCRTSDIPARTVWVSGHCYAEFYLNDDEGQGHWFPCELTEARTFGGIKEYRPIVEKGDNFRPPYSPRERPRFLAEYFTGTGQAKPRFYRSPAAQ